MSPTSRQSAHFPLLALPGPCLLAVLQCCAASDQRSLFSAARAHSRLHQTAALALSSVCTTVRQQQRVNSVLLYLDRHGSHVNSLKLWGLGEEEYRLTLFQMAPTLQLHSLELSGFDVQLLPGNGVQGVLGPAAAAGASPLKQLVLHLCTLLDGDEGVAAALLQLLALEHLSLLGNIVAATAVSGEDWICLSTGVLQQLQQLTYLDLGAIKLQGPDPTTPALQPLQALTKLVDLRLIVFSPKSKLCVTASVLSGMCHLTRLRLKEVGFEPAALAGKAQLQHLEVEGCRGLQPPGVAGVAALLSQLQHQTQLTHLDLHYSMHAVDERSPPAAAYTALTASSKLQHLDISGCKPPASVWQHLFPAGRVLLHLTSLRIGIARQLPHGAATAPEGTRIVSCCPSLQFLDLSSLQYSIQLLTLLQGLSGLQSLRLTTGTWPGVAGGVSADTGEALQAVAQLTGLRGLELYVRDAPTQMLVTQLQQLQQLPHVTALEYAHEGMRAALKQEAPGDEPVWRQLLQLFLEDIDPDVAEEAAAALAQ